MKAATCFVPGCILPPAPTPNATLAPRRCSVNYLLGAGGRNEEKAENRGAAGGSLSASVWKLGLPPPQRAALVPPPSLGMGGWGGAFSPPHPRPSRLRLLILRALRTPLNLRCSTQIVPSKRPRTCRAGWGVSGRQPCSGVGGSAGRPAARRARGLRWKDRGGNSTPLPALVNYSSRAARMQGRPRAAGGPRSGASRDSGPLPRRERGALDPSCRPLKGHEPR